MNIDILCFTGHKGLLGPQGTGGLYVKEGTDIRPLLSGGSGERLPVTATISGLLRGPIRDGYPVSKGFKIADVDPRKNDRRHHKKGVPDPFGGKISTGKAYGTYPWGRNPGAARRRPENHGIAERITGEARPLLFPFMPLRLSFPDAIIQETGGEIMDRQIVTPELSLFPECFHSLMRSGNVYDSSCSPEARVWYIEKDEGFYLKAAPQGSLKKEAEMTRFFHEKGLSAQVLSYESREKDWLLTKRIPGEDCTHASYLQDPERLSALLGERLRSLHDSCGCGCPVPDRTGDYLDTARRNREAGRYDLYFHPDAATVDDAWRIVEELTPCLARDTLLHGDYCLPNIMLLDDWQFSGFIDLGCGGMGDRHVDLFWGVWTLEFNLHTPRYRDRFLDAYGRDRFNPDILPLIGAIEVFG